MSMITQGAMDSAATTHCIPHEYNGGAHQDVPPGKGIGAVCANETIMQSTATDILDLKELPSKARPCDKFKGLSVPLISVKRLCEADLEVHFTNKQVTVTDQLGTTILAGSLDPNTELYMVNLHDDHTNSLTTDALPRGDTQLSQSQ